MGPSLFVSPLVHTTCPRDCPDACGLAVTVEAGRVTRIDGRRDHPITAGSICYRTRAYVPRQTSGERLREPLIRQGGGYRPIPLDEALDLAADQLLTHRSESGPASILHYRSGGSLGLLKGVADAFFNAFGPVSVKGGNICDGAGSAAQEMDFGVAESNDLASLLDARQILVWGKNLAVSSPHTLRFVREARRRGARVALIDPVYQKTAAQADLVIQPRPAADVELALAVASRLFERGWVHPEAASWTENLPDFERLARSRSAADWCGPAEVSVDEVDRLAAMLAPHAGPATLLVGWGMGRRTRGGAIVRALDALALMTGNIGRPGAGVCFYFQRKRGLDSTLGLPQREPPRRLLEPLLGQEILAASDPPVRLVWITAGNPVAMLPDARRVEQALRTRRFVVVVDTHWTDTTACADLVLPVPTFLEDEDVVGAYGHHYLGVVEPALPPPPGVMHETQIYRELARRVGLEGFDRDPRDWLEAALGPEMRRAGMSLEALRQGPRRNPLAPRIAFEGRRFNRPGGKALMMSEPPPPLTPPHPDYPLTLLALSTHRSQSSQWSPSHPDRLEAILHPDVAPVAEGDLCRLESVLGSVVVRLRFDRRQRRDVVIVPKGGHLARGQCANVLVEARLTDMGEGAALYDQPVRLRPLSGDEGGAVEHRPS